MILLTWSIWPVTNNKWDQKVRTKYLILQSSMSRLLAGSVENSSDCNWPILPSRHRACKRPPVASKAFGERPHHGQISICSEISKASSTSIPRYRIKSGKREAPGAKAGQDARPALRVGIRGAY